MVSNNKYFLSHEEPRLDPNKLDLVIRHALLEDVGKGDITTTLTIPKNKNLKANIIAKEDCLLCGMEVLERVFQIVDKEIKIVPKAKEGQKLKKGKVVVALEGKAHGILEGERVALNLLSHLSGIATKTREFVEMAQPHKVKITDTRKTMPGLRELQKYAVRIGGGFNHRMALDEMILIKDNHLQVTDGYTQLPKVPKGYKIEIEVENLDEFKHALKFKPDVIMLDNMKLEDIKKAVEIRNETKFNSHHPQTKLEVSGGITLDTLKDVAATGVDLISVGELTHSVKAIDFGLDVI